MLKDLNGEQIKIEGDQHVKIYQSCNSDGTAHCYNYIYGKLVAESEQELKIHLIETAFVDCTFNERRTILEDFSLEKDPALLVVPKQQIFEIVVADSPSKRKKNKLKIVIGTLLVTAAIAVAPTKMENGLLKYGLIAGAGAGGSVLIASTMEKRIMTDHPWNDPNYFKIPQEVKKSGNSDVVVKP